MSSSQRHHIVPRCLLRGFLADPPRDTQLIVFDRCKEKKYWATLSNVSVEKDFYSFYADGVRPDAVEQYLSTVESKAAPILKQIASTAALPDATEMGTLCRFFALMFERVVRMREHEVKHWNHLLKHVSLLTLGSQPGYDRSITLLRELGKDLSTFPTRDRMRKLLDNGDLRFEITREALLQGMLNKTESVATCLTRRIWTLWVHDGLSSFVCSDAPAVLDWIKPVPEVWGPGFGMTNTMVSIPINNRMLLSARLEGKAGVMSASPEVVALWNNQTCKFANRFIYASRDDFDVMLPDERIGHWSDVVALY